MSNLKKTVIFLAFFVPFLNVPSDAFSAKFELYQDVIGFSGGYGTSGKYNLFSTIGNMPDPSKSESTTYTCYAGFWHPYVFNHFTKAIIVAGSGPTQNQLWKVTGIFGKKAYRTLQDQGYQKENIRYLSADPNEKNLDIDGNKKADDIYGMADNQNLKDAITTWASDSMTLVLYMIGHGGAKTFRINNNEILQADDLNNWLNELQKYIPGNVVIVYDSCYSGSFIPVIAGKNRIIFTSSTASQEVLFTSTGLSSFSNYFWDRFYLGFSVYNAYANAKDAIILSRKDKQTPQFNADENTKPDEKTDQYIAQNVQISDEMIGSNDIPNILEVSPEQTIFDTNSLLIYADSIISAITITNVWAVVMPPINESIDLPFINLAWSETNKRYEGTYDNFKRSGQYYISIFAVNANDTISFPKNTIIEKQFIDTPDLDNDGNITLSDLMIALTILSKSDDNESLNYYVKMENVLKMFNLIVKEDL